MTKATGNNGQPVKGPGKETLLANDEGGGGAFRGKCGNCNKVGNKRAHCTKSKKTGGGGNGGNVSKSCNHCDTKGHLESGCWKKNPDTAPYWFKKKKEATGSSVEMMLSFVENNE